jgi:WD40 repeat protein
VSVVDGKFAIDCHSFLTSSLAPFFCTHRLVALGERTAHIYRFRDLALLVSISTAINSTGICAYVEIEKESVLIVPAVATGSISVIRFDAEDEHKIATFDAHTSAIRCVSISASGRSIATASVVGTLIRLFDSETRSKKREFRRATIPGEICSLAFSRDERWLAVASTNGSLHIFAIPAQIENKASTFSFLKKLSLIPSAAASYFDSEWPFATFKIAPSLWSAGFCWSVSFGSQAGAVIAVATTHMFRGFFNTKAQSTNILALNAQAIFS